MKPFRYILLLIASFLVLFNAVSLTVLRVNYELNKAQIASSLCEKKEVKENTCQGKCHLKKQMQRAEKSGKALPGIENVMTEYSVSTLQIIHPEKNFKLLPVANRFRTRSMHSAFTPGDIFHPPCA